jgi:hypothetical protein
LLVQQFVEQKSMKEPENNHQVRTLTGRLSLDTAKDKTVRGESSVHNPATRKNKNVRKEVILFKT